jgi:hypothetical protein
MQYIFAVKLVTNEFTRVFRKRETSNLIIKRFVTVKNLFKFGKLLELGAAYFI